MDVDVDVDVPGYVADARTLSSNEYFTVASIIIFLKTILHTPQPQLHLYIVQITNHCTDPSCNLDVQIEEIFRPVTF